MNAEDGLKSTETRQSLPLENCLPELMTQLKQLIETNHRLSQAIESLVVINHEVLEALLNAYAPEGEPPLGQSLDG